jgi:hypothetical protein
MVNLIVSSFLLSAAISLAGQMPVSHTADERVFATAILHELNLARQNPSSYARFLQETSSSLRTHEGVRAVDEAIRFLRDAQPRPPLALSPGLCRAAADHCRDQANGAMGHNGSDGSNPASRINRYGKWQGAWAENMPMGSGARATSFLLSSSMMACAVAATAKISLIQTTTLPAQLTVATPGSGAFAISISLAPTRKALSSARTNYFRQRSSLCCRRILSRIGRTEGSALSNASRNFSRNSFRAFR